MKIKENNKLKLISLLIAVLLFMSVNEKIKNFSVVGNTESKTSTWVRDVPLEVEYDREKLYLVGIPSTVSVKLTGTSAKIQKESITKSFKAKLNLSNISVGNDQRVKVDIEGLDGLEAVSDPEYLTVSIRERVTKEFDVTPIVKTERLLLGYQIKSTKTTDSKVKISGAKESIDNIYEVRAENDNRTKLSKDIREEVNFVAYDKNYNRIEDIEISPKTTVMDIELTEVKKDIPLVVNRVGSLPKGKELNSIFSVPDTITVRAANEEILDRIKEVYVDVELDDLSDELTERSNLKVYIKEDYQVSFDTPTVKVSIKIKNS